MSEGQGQEISTRLLRRFEPANQIAEGRLAGESQGLAESSEWGVEMQRARGEFGQLMERLDTTLLNLARLCEQTHTPTGWEWRLNDAVLRVAIPQLDPEDPIFLMRSFVAIECEGKGYRKWSHSLQCLKNEAQWYEVRYLHIQKTNEPPFALELAQEIGRGKYKAESWPLNGNTFIEKWLGRFADAARGDLRPDLKT